MQLFSIVKKKNFVQWMICFMGASVPLSGVSTGYTIDYLTDTLYSFDLSNGNYTPIISIPGSIDFVDLQAGFNSDTLYGLGYNDRNLYIINPNNKTYGLVTTSAIGDVTEQVYSVGLVNTKTAYVVGFSENKIYRVDLEQGTSSTLLSFAGNPGLTNIAIKDSTTAYVVGYLDNNLYEVNLGNGTYRLVTPVSVGSPGTPFLEGLALVGDSAYVVGNMDGNLYEVDLATGGFSLVTPVRLGAPSVNLINLGISGGVGYTVNNLGGEIYAIQLTDGSYRVLANIPGVNLTGMAFLSPTLTNTNNYIDVTDLDGNNLSLANYLNQYASQDDLGLFYGLGSQLPSALQSVASTRNACLTYASQMGYLALNRLVHDHSRQKSFQLCAQRTGCGIDKPNTTQAKCQNTTTLWLAPFGDYTHIHEQHQTPSFDMRLGGVVGAWDYNGENHNLFGMGAAYLYTSIHEQQQAGHGHIDQGLLMFYGTVTRGNGYVDLGVSGGFYSGRSVRRISFRGFKETTTSYPHGWQFASSIEIGYHKYAEDHCTSPKFGVSPFLLLDWVGSWEQKLKERGARQLNMGHNARFCSLLHAEGGLWLHETLRWEGGKAVFREKIAYSYQKEFSAGSIQAYIVGSPGYFNLNTLSEAQNLGIIHLSALILSDHPKRPYFDLWYEGQFGSGYQLYQVAFEVGKNF